MPIFRRPSSIPVERITAEQAMSLIRDGRGLAVDVRFREEFERGHLPGARSVPIDELRSELPRLPRDKILIFY